MIEFNPPSPREGLPNKFNFVLSAFGLTTVVPRIFNGDQLTQDQASEGDKTSQLGTPYFDNLIFEEGEFVRDDGTVETYEGLEVQTVLLTVNQSKIIVKTPVQGKPGTVKEYISLGDYQVNIRGALVSSNPFEKPEEDLQKLVTLVNVPDSISIASEFLQQFTTGRYVVDSYSFPQQEGFRNVQLFNITLSSDEDPAIKIKLGDL